MVFEDMCRVGNRPNRCFAANHLPWSGKHSASVCNHHPIKQIVLSANHPPFTNSVTRAAGTYLVMTVLSMLYQRRLPHRQQEGLTTRHAHERSWPLR